MLEKILSLVPPAIVIIVKDAIRNLDDLYQTINLMMKPGQAFVKQQKQQKSTKKDQIIEPDSALLHQSFT